MPSASCVGGEGDVLVDGAGSITASADEGNAIGILAYGSSATVDNHGDVSAIAYHGDAIGASVYADGNVAVTNSGSITAHAAGETIGLLLGGGDATLTNSGLIGAIHADYAVALDLEQRHRHGEQHRRHRRAGVGRRQHRDPGRRRLRRWSPTAATSPARC